MTASPSEARELSLLAARAADLARPADDHRNDARVDLLVLTVGRQQAALFLEDVAAVRPPRPVAQVPGSNGVLVGVVGGGGDVLPVADLAALMGATSTMPHSDRWGVVLSRATPPLGLLADAASDVVTVRRDDLGAPSASGGLARSLLSDGTVVLDIAALLRHPALTLTSPDHTQELPWQES